MRIALVWTADCDFPAVVADGDIPVFSVDERRPDDRVYLMGPGVDRVSPSEFDALIAGKVHALGDKPVVEQAARAMLDRKPNGKPNLKPVT